MGENQMVKNTQIEMMCEKYIADLQTISRIINEGKDPSKFINNNIKCVKDYIQNNYEEC